jgi:hypothetical protein
MYYRQMKLRLLNLCFETVSCFQQINELRIDVTQFAGPPPVDDLLIHLPTVPPRTHQARVPWNPREILVALGMGLNVLGPPCVDYTRVNASGWVLEVDPGAVWVAAVSLVMKRESSTSFSPTLDG